MNFLRIHDRLGGNEGNNTLQVVLLQRKNICSASIEEGLPPTVA